MKKNYSFVSLLLWKISGNEIWLIKESPTVYNYYASQGLILLMTFLFASFCGTFAGYAFSDNTFIIYLFGFVWGFLVYSIDRMMVQSIDKVNVDQMGLIRKTYIYFFPRVFLGVLLALFMSSPLDHFLFKDQIEDQMQKNAQQSWIGFQDKLKSAMDLDGQKGNVNKKSLYIDQLRNALGKNPTTSIYIEAKNSYDNQYPNLLSIQKEKNMKFLEKNKALSNVPILYNNSAMRNRMDFKSNQYNIYMYKLSQYQKALASYNRIRNEILKYENIMNQEKEKYYYEINKKIQSQESELATISSHLDSDNKKLHERTENRKSFVESMHGFDTKFMTLLTHPDFGVQFLRWFIFLVFLVIEILPTWMKLNGKPTEYDLRLSLYRDNRIKQAKTNFASSEEILDKKHQLELSLLNEKENIRKNIELENYSKILNEMAKKQSAIAFAILNEWESQVVKESNYNEYINK
jgi:hypothetical protein